MDITITPAEAAQLLGRKNVQGIREALKQGRVEWGYAVKNPGGRWSYIISKKKFYNFCGLEAEQ